MVSRGAVIALDTPPAIDPANNASYGDTLDPFFKWSSLCSLPIHQYLVLDSNAEKGCIILFFFLVFFLTMSALSEFWSRPD